MNAVLLALQERSGIHFVGQPNADFQKKDSAGNGLNLRVAMDAQPSLVTVSNSGIPAFLSTYIDPKLIEILVAPMKAAEVCGGLAEFASPKLAAMQAGMRRRHTPPHSHATLLPAALPTSLASIESDGPCGAKVYGRGREGPKNRRKLRLIN